MINSFNEELIQFVESKAFKIDTLLPNYVILQRIHPEYQHEPTKKPQLCRIFHIQICEDIFDSIMSVVRDTFKTTIRLFMLSVKKDRIPKKNCIMEMVEKHFDNEIKAWEIDPELKRIIDPVKTQLMTDVTIFLFALTQLQDVYTVYLRYQFFIDLESISTYDEDINLNWFIAGMQEQIKSHLKLILGTSKGLTYDFLIDQLGLLDVARFMNEQISTFYMECKGYLAEAVTDFTVKSDESVIMNKYLIIGLLQELSNRAYKIIDNYLLFSMYLCSDVQIRVDFAHFVIFNFENLNLIANDQDHESSLRHKIQSCQSLIDELREQIEDEEQLQHRVVEAILSRLIKKDMHVILHHVINKRSRKIGVHISTVNAAKQVAFIVHKPEDRIVITNAKLVPNSWQFYKPSLNMGQLFDEKLESEHEYQSIEHVFHEEVFEDHMVHVSHLKYKEMDHTSEGISNGINNASTHTYEAITIGPQAGMGPGIYMSGAAGDIGTSLGYCLANINRYTSKKEFFKDFGTMAAMNGSITYLAMNMPVIGKLVAIGGFGYFAMKIYKNDSASKQSKKDQFNKLLIGTSTGISTSIGGAIIGQALIPVPILGALIGGFLGGLAGGVSTSILFEYMNEKKARVIVADLEDSQQPDGGWEYSDELIAHIGLSLEYFNEQLPLNLRFDEEHDLKWLILICYGFLCLYYTQKDELDRLERKKARKKKHQKTHSSPTLKTVSTSDLDSDHSSKTERCLHVKDQDINFEDEDQQVEAQYDSDDEEEDFRPEWPKSIDKSHNWLLKHEVVVLHAIGNIENALRSVIGNL